jgi:hypothetical protein
LFSWRLVLRLKNGWAIHGDWISEQFARLLLQKPPETAFNNFPDPGMTFRAVNQCMIAMKINRYKHLNVNVFPTRGEMGLAAGRDIEARVAGLLKVKDEVRMVFAAAPSQNEMLDYLALSEIIDWGRVTAFHMDEYIGLNGGAAQLFSKYLQSRLFDRVRMKNVHILNGSADTAYESVRYAALISESPLDVICLGIGENGHIAFNDPPVADFNDPLIVKEVAPVMPYAAGQRGMFRKPGGGAGKGPHSDHTCHLWCIAPLLCGAGQQQEGGCLQYHQWTCHSCLPCFGVAEASRLQLLFRQGFFRRAVK